MLLCMPPKDGISKECHFLKYAAFFKGENFSFKSNQTVLLKTFEEIVFCVKFEELVFYLRFKDNTMNAHSSIK